MRGELANNSILRQPISMILFNLKPGASRVDSFQFSPALEVGYYFVKNFYYFIVIAMTKFVFGLVPFLLLH